MMSDSESSTDIVVGKSNSEVSQNSRSKKVPSKKRTLGEPGVQRQESTGSKKQKTCKKNIKLNASDDETPIPRSKKPKSKTLAEKVTLKRSKDLSLVDEESAASSGWALDDDSDDYVSAENRASRLRSTLIRQVPGGKVCRFGHNLTGNLFLELKLYNVADIESIASKDRWEKALVNLKIQVDSDSPEVSHIKKVLKICKEHFTEEGTFYRE